MNMSTFRSQILVMCSLASSVWAADKDWLDEMPTIPAVV